MNSHDTIATERRAELVAVAQAMLDGRLHLIEGARKICALRFAVGEPDNEVFMPIRSTESETDHFPLGEMRSRCAIEYLERTDREMDRYLAKAKLDILAACEGIVRTFSAHR